MTPGGTSRPRLHGRSAAAAPRLSALRGFLRTEAGGAVVLLVATIVSLVWANSPWRDGYHALWATELALSAGSWELRHDLGTHSGWVWMPGRSRRTCARGAMRLASPRT